MLPLAASFAGLPISAWLLVLAAAGIGLGLEAAFLRGQRRRRRLAEERRPTGPPAG